MSKEAVDLSTPEWTAKEKQVAEKAEKIRDEGKLKAR